MHRFKNTGTKAATALFNIKVACQSQPECSKDKGCKEQSTLKKHISLCIPQHSFFRRRAVTTTCPAGTFSMGVKCSATTGRERIPFDSHEYASFLRGVIV